MARTNEPHSASSQFFINLVNNSSLDHTEETIQGWGYAVFGKVINGLDIVDDIAKVETHSKDGHNDVPVDVISITGTTIK